MQLAAVTQHLDVFQLILPTQYFTLAIHQSKPKAPTPNPTYEIPVRLCALFKGGYKRLYVLQDGIKILTGIRIKNEGAQFCFDYEKFREIVEHLFIILIPLTLQSEKDLLQWTFPGEVALWMPATSYEKAYVVEKFPIQILFLYPFVSNVNAKALCKTIQFRGKGHESYRPTSYC